MQHTDMYAVGESGKQYNIDQMRKQAMLRLERDGWATIIHHHPHSVHCKDPSNSLECEHYGDTDG